jgi:hypothetical protein
MKIRDNKRGFKRRHQPAMAALALGALMSFQAGAAQADDHRRRDSLAQGTAETA